MGRGRAGLTPLRCLQLGPVPLHPEGGLHPVPHPQRAEHAGQVGLPTGEEVYQWWATSMITRLPSFMTRKGRRARTPRPNWVVPSKVPPYRVDRKVW